MKQQFKTEQDLEKQGVTRDPFLTVDPSRISAHQNPWWWLWLSRIGLPMSSLVGAWLIFWWDPPQPPTKQLCSRCSVLLTSALSSLLPLRAFPFVISNTLLHVFRVMSLQSDSSHSPFKQAISNLPPTLLHLFPGLRSQARETNSYHFMEHICRLSLCLPKTSFMSLRVDAADQISLQPSGCPWMTLITLSWELKICLD